MIFQVLTRKSLIHLDRRLGPFRDSKSRGA